MSIVNDGLVLYFDAIDNAVNGVHDGSTTVWVDLSGNGNNGILNGGTWGENFLHFDGRSWVTSYSKGYDDYYRKNRGWKF